MCKSRRSLLGISLSLFMAYSGSLCAQDSASDIGSDTLKESVLIATDTRVVALTEAYHKKQQELRQQFIADVQALGQVEMPAHMKDVAKGGTKWAYNFDWGGLTSHSIAIDSSDVESTERWHPLLATPPLGPGEALSAADSTLREWYKESPGVSFQMKQLSLVPLAVAEGKWYWEAVYTVLKGPRKSDITMAIRMDGKVLTQLKSVVRPKQNPQ